MVKIDIIADLLESRKTTFIRILKEDEKGSPIWNSP